MGADVVNVTASASSVTKGESLRDTVETLQALGAQHRRRALIAVGRARRHRAAHSRRGGQRGRRLARAPDTGAARPLHHAAPSRRASGRRIVILGDILHSRVARSNVWSLTAMGAEVVLCGPPTLLAARHAAALRRAPRPWNWRAAQACIVEPRIEARAGGRRRGDGAAAATRTPAGGAAALAARIHAALWPDDRSGWRWRSPARSCCIPAR